MDSRDNLVLSVVFDYAVHAPDVAAADKPWPVRPDPFSSYRPGFEVRTLRRVQRVRFFHNFAAEGVGADALVRSIDLQYHDEIVPADPVNPIYRMLASVTQTGYSSDSGTLVARSLPALELTYSLPTIVPDVFQLDAESLRNLPEGVDGSRYQ